MINSHFTRFSLITILVLYIGFTGCISDSNEDSTIDNLEVSKKTDKKLRHVVLFKFKEDVNKEDITKVEQAFKELPKKIPEIKDFEWGTNNSPEGLDKGFTHCFFLTFDSEDDRSIYLPHPDHKAFGQVLRPYLEDVLVVDYWIEK